MEAIGAVSEKVNDINRRLDDYIYSSHSESTININKTEDAVCELSESTEESIAALEQAICDLSEEVGGK